MGKSSAPDAPNYVGAANATAAGNLAAAQAQSGLSKYNTVTPYGTSTWSRTEAPLTGSPTTDENGNPIASPGQPIGPPTSWGDALVRGLRAGRGESLTTANYGAQPMDIPQAGDETLTLALNPQQQALFYAAQNIQGSMATAAQGNLGKFQNLVANGIDTSGLTPIVGSIDQPTLNGNVQSPTQLQTALNTAGVIPLQQSGYQSALSFDNAPSYSPGQLNTQLDFSNLQGLLPDSAGINQKAYDAVLSQQKMTLDPQFEQEQKNLTASLANQGLVPGSEAWRAAMDQFSTSRNQAYGNAANNATLTGYQVGNQDFQNALSKYTTLLNQDVTSGNFTNNAITGNNNANLGARQQSVGETATQGQFANQAAGLQNAANLAANNQGFTQALASGQFGNEATTQQLGNELAKLGFSNETAQSGFGNALSAAALANSANAQEYGQAVNNQETQYNQLGSLIQGSSNYQMPNFGSNQSATQSIAGPDYVGAATGNYNSALNAASIDNANANAATGTAASVIATIAAYY